MSDASIYLRAPVKVENNHINSKPSSLKWVAYTVGLAALASYAPKIFLAASVGIICYQVIYFNQLVQSAGKTQHQKIREWTITACQVIVSIGIVFALKSLPCFWSALVSIRHLHLFECAGYVVKGGIMLGIGYMSKPFYNRAFELATQRQWVEMEDYVENYPAAVKKEILSSPENQLIFYISAVIPETLLARKFSKKHLAFNQFQSQTNKHSPLIHYSDRLLNPKKEELLVAVHQIQQFDAASQFDFGPLMVAIEHHFSEEERDQFPDDIKAVLLKQRLKDFKTILYPTNDRHAEWAKLVNDFHKLDKDRQLLFGNHWLSIIQTSQKESIPYFSETIRLVALKASLSLPASDAKSGSIQTNLSMEWAVNIFTTLSRDLQVSFGSHLKEITTNGILKATDLPREMQEAITAFEAREKKE